MAAARRRASCAFVWCTNGMKVIEAAAQQCHHSERCKPGVLHVVGLRGPMQARGAARRRASRPSASRAWRCNTRRLRDMVIGVKICGLGEVQGRGSQGPAWGGCDGMRGIGGAAGGAGARTLQRRGWKLLVCLSRNGRQQVVAEVGGGLGACSRVRVRSKSSAAAWGGPCSLVARRGRGTGRPEP
jgi:hypothetical protein